MLSFFGSANKEDPSPDVIKSELTAYRNMVHEPIGYIAGDYVVLKPEASMISHQIKNYPTIGCIQTITYTEGKVIIIVAYVKDDNVYFSNKPHHYLYKKASVKDDIPLTLKQFVDNTPVTDSVEPGTFVQFRANFKPFWGYSLTNSSVYSIYLPAIVMENKDGLITIAGHSVENDDIITDEFNWYELAPYIN